MSGVTDAGIVVYGDRNTISYNTISGVTTSYYPGIYLSDTNNNEIVHNTVFNCPYAVMLYAGEYTGICNNNHVAYNHFESIHTNYMAYIHDKTCVGNIFEDNTYKGTWLTYNNGTGTIIRNNIKQS
jgi:parallel beta-helix repeat protein